MKHFEKLFNRRLKHLIYRLKLLKHFKKLFNRRLKLLICRLKLLKHFKKLLIHFKSLPIV